ncbi:MAG: YoaP domain-containing protein [Phycisphaerae bacterium]|jgi:L-amino acid N-acyltransferase YncA
MNDVKIIDLNPSNVSDYGFCGYKSSKQEGHRRKTEWLKKRFAEGMRFKVLHVPAEGTVGFIEYMPGELTWRPIDAPGYLTIHCIMINRKKYKSEGYGSVLLDACIKDARETGVNGVAAVTSKGTWMASSGLFLKHGFEVVDAAPPSYELLVKKIREGPVPAFRGGWDQRARRCGKGVVIFRSDQCPCIAGFTSDILEVCNRLGVSVRVKELKTCKQAQNAPSPYGIFNIVYNGRLIADHPISATRFRSLIGKVGR